MTPLFILTLMAIEFSTRFSFPWRYWYTKPSNWMYSFHAIADTCCDSITSIPITNIGVRLLSLSLQDAGYLGRRFLDTFGQPKQNTSHGTHAVIWILFAFLVTQAMCSDHTNESGSSPPQFNATKIKYMSWFTAWCGWVALKYPELIDLIQGEEDAPAETDIEARTEYQKKNKRVYGALIQSVPPALRTSLAANARYNGIEALELLKQRFGVVDAHDRSAALKRAQKSYILPGAGVSVRDVTKQYDSMTLAHSEYMDAGGNELDDELLRSCFLSALPASYQAIKAAIRMQSFDTFDDLYSTVLVQVKQFEDDADEQRNVSALSSILPQSVLAALQSSHGPEVLAYLSTSQSRGRGGRGFGRGQMGRGRGGRGRGNFSIVTCLRCGMLGHSRTLCTSRAVQCGHCKADHLDALCPLGPGGAQRDALSAGASRSTSELRRGYESRGEGRASSSSQA